MSPLVPFILPISPGVLPVTLMIRYIVFLPIILPPDDTWCSRDPVSSWCLPPPALTPPSSTPRRQPQARKPIIHWVSPQIKNIWASALCSIFKTHLSVIISKKLFMPWCASRDPEKQHPVPVSRLSLRIATIVSMQLNTMQYHVIPISRTTSHLQSVIASASCHFCLRWEYFIVWTN